MIEPAWVNAIVNLGAVGILGYWLILTLPAMLARLDADRGEIVRRLLEDQVAERKNFAATAEKISCAIDKLRSTVERSNLCQSESRE